MKKLLPLILLLGVCWCYALENVTSSAYTVSYQWQKERGESPEAVMTKTYALPATRAALQVQDMRVAHYRADGTLDRISTDIDDSRVSISQQFTMRELHAFSVQVQQRVEDGSGWSEVEEVSYTLDCTSTVALPTSVSEAFVPIYKRYVDNYDRSYMSDLPITRPRELVVAYENHNSDPIIESIRYMQSWATWKRQSGTDVDFVSTETIGTTNTAIKAYIQNQWNSGNRYDFILLIGDVNGNYVIPTFTTLITGENKATDLAYGLLEGSDYFPESLVGRFSVDTPSDIRTICNKQIFYEKNPLNTPEALRGWLNRGSIIAGNYDENGDYPVTPVAMSKVLHDEMMEAGFASVDSIFRYATHGPMPGDTEIENSINNGAGFISYRGWGDVSGWHFPQLRLSDFTNEGLNNSYTPAVVFSIVCNTGDFINNTDPCFGEKWLAYGSSTTPKGAVAFVGPSYLHTSTPHNNALSTGCFNSILHDNALYFGTAVEAGKMEHWRQFPLLRAADNTCQKYAEIYNMLGDAGVRMWVTEPTPFTVTAPTNVNSTQNYVDIHVANGDGALVSVTQNFTDYTYAKVRGGVATVLYDPSLASDSLVVTVTAKQRLPWQGSIYINNNAGNVVTLASNPLQGVALAPAGSYNLSLNLKNWGTTAANSVSGTLSCNNQYITVTQGNCQFGNIAAQGTASANAAFTVSSDCPANESFVFTLDTNAGDSKFAGYINGMYLNITGQTITGGNIRATITNQSVFDINGINVTVEALTNAVTLSQNTFNLGNLQAGASTTLTIPVNLASNVAIGRTIAYKLVFTDNLNRDCLRYGYVSNGTPAVTDPTGPDAYGYYIYDSGDTAYSSHPTYNWVEIDPSEASPQYSGTVIYMRDDVSAVTDLPFTFRFYGHDYSQVTLCSNGWLSFGQSEQFDFNNWYLPAFIGPRAVVAGYWDDLKGVTTPDSSYADMDICHYYDSANHRYIVEWNKAYNRYDNSPTGFVIKFEIILLDPAYNPTTTGDGEIIVQYHTVSNPDSRSNYCTVGIQNWERSMGMNYTYANQYEPGAATLADGLALRITTKPADNYTPADDNVNIPSMVKVGNSPNPFNPSTTIWYDMPTTGKARINVYDMRGRKVARLFEGNVQAGHHSLVFNAQNLASGVYFVRLETSGQVVTGKMLLLK